MIHKLALESGHVLKYRRHFLDFGIVAYDVQHQRHKLVKIVNNIDEIIGLKNKGWRVCGSRHDWLMQAPEAVLCDLNEPVSNMATQDLIEIFAMHKYLTSYHKCCDMDYLIKESGMSRTAFFKEFKKITGKTPVSYFTDLKLESARGMLLNTTRKISDIAESLSFYDEYYFSKIFKKKMGIPPSCYRAKHRVERG